VQEDYDNSLHIFEITEEVKLLLEKEELTVDDAIDDDHRKVIGDNSASGTHHRLEKPNRKVQPPLLPSDGKSGVHGRQRRKTS
jgi:hypothetical protein